VGVAGASNRLGLPSFFFNNSVIIVAKLLILVLLRRGSWTNTRRIGIGIELFAKSFVRQVSTFLNARLFTDKID